MTFEEFINLKITPYDLVAVKNSISQKVRVGSLKVFQKMDWEWAYKISQSYVKNAHEWHAYSLKLKNIETIKIIHKNFWRDNARPEQDE